MPCPDYKYPPFWQTNIDKGLQGSVILLTRRTFLRYCLSGAASAGLSTLLLPHLAEAFSLLPGGKPPVIWIEGTSCSGNSISLDNIADPPLRHVLEEMIDLRYSQLFMWAQGQEATALLMETVEAHRDRFILVVEGGIPMGLPEAVFVGEKDGAPLQARELIPLLGEAARVVVAVGNCAAFGGPSMANPNPTGTRGVWRVVRDKPVINVPGCPAHPDWIVGTLAHTILYGLPRVDEYRRPTLFFGQLVHDICPRRAHFSNGVFAEAPGQSGCLFKVGCKGPITHADCPTRKFNDGVNWCINANNPCIGCAAPDFPDGGTSPFFARLGDIRVPPGVKTTAMTVAKGVAAATAVGIGAHLATGLRKGRLGEALSPPPQPEAEPDGADLQRHLEAEEDSLRRLRTGQERLQKDIRRLLQNGAPRTRRSLLTKLNPLRFLRKKNRS
jgi:hydrogenase small subunit